MLTFSFGKRMGFYLALLLLFLSSPNVNASILSIPCGHSLEEIPEIDTTTSGIGKTVRASIIDGHIQHASMSMRSHVLATYVMSKNPFNLCVSLWYFALNQHKLMCHYSCVYDTNSHPVYGGCDDGHYSADSNPCFAAAHAGYQLGVPFAVKITDGRGSSYSGCDGEYEYASQSKGSYDVSFEVLPPRAANSNTEL